MCSRSSPGQRFPAGETQEEILTLLGTGVGAKITYSKNFKIHGNLDPDPGTHLGPSSFEKKSRGKK